MDSLLREGNKARLVLDLEICGDPEDDKLHQKVSLEMLLGGMVDGLDFADEPCDEERGRGGLSGEIDRMEDEVCWLRLVVSTTGPAIVGVALDWRLSESSGAGGREGTDDAGWGSC